MEQNQGIIVYYKAHLKLNHLNLLWVLVLDTKKEERVYNLTFTVKLQSQEKREIIGNSQKEL